MKKNCLEDNEIPEIPFDTLLSHISHIVAAAGSCKDIEISSAHDSNVRYFFIDRFALVPAVQIFGGVYVSPFADAMGIAKDYLCDKLGERYSCKRGSKNRINVHLREQ